MGPDLLAGERQHLYLFGDVGRGKSRLAASVLNELADRGTRCAFIRVSFLVLAQMRAIDDAAHKADAGRFLDVALGSEAAALDDIAGGEKGSDFVRGLVVTILDRRFDRGLRTIITSNLSLQQISEFYTDTRIPSRMQAPAVRRSRSAAPTAGRLSDLCAPLATCGSWTDESRRHRATRRRRRSGFGRGLAGHLARGASAPGVGRFSSDRP
jgi:predicted ATPase